MSIDPQIKFTRARNGYDPEEVDSLFDEFQLQIVDLKKRNNSLSETIDQLNEKLELLTQNIEKLEYDRVQESLLATRVMNSAAQIAEQKEREARQKAELMLEQASREAGKMIEQARTNFASVYTTLVQLGKNTQIIRQNNERYVTDANVRLAEIERFLQQALGDIPRT